MAKMFRYAVGFDWVSHVALSTIYAIYAMWHAARLHRKDTRQKSTTNASCRNRCCDSAPQFQCKLLPKPPMKRGWEE
jgi:hypothetical protein